jgi:hypothetical protein
MIALASPTCHDCEQPVQRVEIPWHRTDEGQWWPGPCFMVCADGHRVYVEEFE